MIDRRRLLPSTVPSPLSRPAARIALALVAAGWAVLAGGCAKTPPDKNVVASVGERKITQAYYEDKLSHLKAEDLPRDAAGQPIDTATLPGKQEFLDVIINKDLMALKAKELGLESDDQITKASEAIMQFAGPKLMHYDLIEKPANTVTDAEIADYYQKLQKTRKCSFLICNFEDDAKKARQAVVDGKLWADVADQYNDGSRGPANDYTVVFEWGKLEDSFQNSIWALKEGEISQPIPSVYGWWIIRLDKIDTVQVPPLDQIKDKVLASVRAHKINSGRKAFMLESRTKHEFKMDEGALWTIFQGLPKGEVMLDPVTNKPVPRDQLKPLDIPLSDMDKFFYQVRMGDKLETVTVGDYKSQFDNMNVFERPKRDDLLGGVRERIMGIVDRELLLQEAKERGYMNDPRALANLQDKQEQLMVTKLHDQVVKYDETVTPEQANAFWQDHKSEYNMPETRYGQVLYCGTQDEADQATAALKGGVPWDDAYAKFGNRQAEKVSGRKIGPVPGTAPSNPLKDALFGLAQSGDTTPAFQVQKIWAIVRLDSVVTAHPRELKDAINEVGERIKTQRAEEALQKLLAEWRNQYPVKVWSGRLQKCRSYTELAALPKTPEPLRDPLVR